MKSQPHLEDCREPDFPEKLQRELDR